MKKNSYYHCLVGLRNSMYEPLLKEPELIIDRFLTYTRDDIQKVYRASILQSDKLFPELAIDANDLCKCSKLLSSISHMELRARMNNMTICHFSSDFEITFDIIETIVNNANNGIESDIKLLKNSII